MTTQHGQMKTC